jgi:hypothetical protein
MRLVISLEQHGDVQHRLVQRAAFRAQLIGIDRFMLEAQRDVQNISTSAPRFCLSQPYSQPQNGDRRTKDQVY